MYRSEHGIFGTAESSAPSIRYLKVIACAYLAIVLIGGSIICMRVPPFQTPDEPNHFFRAFQVSEGHAFSKWSGREYGGEIEAAYSALLGATFRLIGNAGEKLSEEDIRAIWSLRTDGRRHFASFPNTANYSPLGYVPQAIGIRLARSFTDVAVVHLLAARFANLICFAAAVAAAVLLFPPAMPAFLWLSSLPMVLSLAGSAAQDATVISASVLLAAVILRLVAPLRESDSSAQATLVVGAALLLLLSIIRPPYLPLVLLLPTCAYALGHPTALRLSLVLATLVVICAAAYSLMVASGGLLRLRPDVDPVAQTQFLVGHPFTFLAIVIDTISENWANFRIQTIGVLGWLEVLLPKGAYVVFQLTSAMAGLALALSLARLPWERLAGRSGLGGSPAVIFAGAAFGTVCSMLLLFAAQYITWTPPRSGIVEGVQGRYFYTLLITSVPTSLAALVALPRVRGPLRRLVFSPELTAIFCAAMIATTVWSTWLVVTLVGARYYWQ